MKKLFPKYRTCPICQAPEAVPIPSGPANFYRCPECHQAVKQNEQGRLEPWLDIYSAGRKQQPARTRAEGRKSF